MPMACMSKLHFPKYLADPNQVSLGHCHSQGLVEVEDTQGYTTDSS